MEEKRCTNCGSSEMQFLRRENIQLGKTGWFSGNWGNLWAGAIEVEFWACPNCRKLDLYVPETPPKGTGTMMVD